MKRLILAVLASAITSLVMVAPAAHADPAGDAICRLLAAGNTPDRFDCLDDVIGGPGLVGV